MYIIDYLSKHSLIDICTKIYKYKVDSILKKIMGLLFKNSKLKDIIIIESHNDFDCNGGAFYKYLIQEGYNKKYKIVWRLKNPQLVKEKLPYNVSWVYENKPGIVKNYYCWTAKYFFSDDKISVSNRKGQISVYCTHGGCTFKNVKGLIKVPDNVSYILSSSKNYDPYMCSNYSIPYPNNRMLHIGFPSNDELFKCGNNELGKITNKKFKKIILWMPTFRKSKSGRQDCDTDLPLGIPLIDNIEKLNSLNLILKDLNCGLIIKFHPMQDMSSIKQYNKLNNIFMLDGERIKILNVDIYKLMACCNGLISDYSSSAYSYLMLNRPLGFVLSDLHEYKLGFSVDDMDRFLVGKKIYSYLDFVQFIKDVVEENDIYDTKRRELLNWMYKYCDGNASKRLAEFLNL